MNPVVSPSPIERFAIVIGALRQAVAAWGGRGVLQRVVVFLLYRRLAEICGRFERLAVRFASGRVLRREVGAGRVAVVRRGSCERVLPVRFGWLVRVAGFEAAGFGSQLRAVLAEPEMVALLASVPQAARLLRPLCRMLAVEVSVLRPAMTVMAGGGVAVGVGWAGDVQAILEGGVVSGLGAPLVRNV